MNKLIETFCDVDDFCCQFFPEWEAQLIVDGTKKRRRSSKVSSKLGANPGKDYERAYYRWV